MTTSTTKTLFLTRLCALALLAAPFAQAEPTGYYRWKDDKGQFQATQQPPADRPSEYIRLSTGISTPVGAGETVDKAKPDSDKSTDPAGAKPRPVGIQGVPDRDPEKCEAARNTREVLNSHARIREKDANGDYRYLAEDEIAEQKRLADEAVAVYCE